jgi:hypothetical protein
LSLSLKSSRMMMGMLYSLIRSYIWQ